MKEIYEHHEEFQELQEELFVEECNEAFATLQEEYKAANENIVYVAFK